MVTDDYTQYWRDRQAWQQQKERELARSARRDAEEIVRLLVDRFDAKQAILFGSLVKDRFTMGSDIDLAVAGIAKSRFFEAMAAANSMTEFWVDLKPIESLETHFWQRVLATGECLYETH